MLRVRAFAVALVLLAACAGPEPADGGAMNLQEAQRRAEAAVDATVEATASDLRIIEREEPIEASCHDSLGAPTETLNVTVAVEVDLAETDMTLYFRDVQAHWEDQGMQVSAQNLDSDLPALIGRAEGFEYAMQGARERNHVRIVGNTPCLPAEEG